jgi:FkbM family methyltransferase
VDLKTRAWAKGKALLAFSKRSHALGWIDLVARRVAPILLRPPSAESTLRTPEGFELKVPARFASAFSYRAGVYEPEVGRTLRQILEATEGDFVDVGANIGYLSLLVDRLAPGRRQIWSFEADPGIWPYLSYNLLKNGASRATAVKEAVADTDGMNELAIDRYGSEGHLMRTPGMPDHKDSVRVPTRSLDSFFAEQGWPAIAAIKMDIEGSEARAVRGMRETVRRNPRMNLVVEVNPPALARAGDTPDRLLDLLRELGFTRLSEIESGRTISGKLRINSWSTINILAMRDHPTHGAA